MGIKKVVEFFNPLNPLEETKRDEIYDYPPEFRPSETDQKRLSRGSGLLAVLIFLVTWTLSLPIAPLNYVLAFLVAFGANRYWHARAQRKAAQIARKNYTRQNLISDRPE